MIHYMKLRREPFLAISSGEKTYELRLYDEKRRAIRVGDIIEFTETESAAKVRRIVTELLTFPGFSELYRSLPLLKCGYTKENVQFAPPEDMNAYYSPSEEREWGVIAIGLCEEC